MAGGAALTAARHIALCFKLLDDGGNSVHALFAFGRKPLDREIPAVVFGEHQGKQPLGFQRKVRVAECRVGDNREVALMRGADDSHSSTGFLLTGLCSCSGGIPFLLLD